MFVDSMNDKSSRRNEPVSAQREFNASNVHAKLV